MSYTVLRVVDAGIPLYDEHERRFLRSGPAAASAFQAFATRATTGIYRLTWTHGHLDVERRETVSLFDGIPVRYVPSPLRAAAGLVGKTPAPNEYAPLRIPGIATLLTSPDGEEIYESCTASVVEWDDGFIAPPNDRPRLLSTTLSALMNALPMRTAAIQRGSALPLALINAVTGLVAPEVRGRSPLPAQARVEFDRVWTASTRRP